MMRQPIIAVVSVSLAVHVTVGWPDVYVQSKKAWPGVAAKQFVTPVAHVELT
jgi:hypothetical protein